MVIAVIAAGGRSGQMFVKAALEAGHRVRAGVRGQNPFPPNDNLQTFECDATDKKQLANLLQGADAVVSLIGHVKGSPANVQTEAIKNVVQVMGQLGIKRLISLTGTGARMPGDKITLMDRFLNLGVGIVDPARVRDGRDHLEVLKQGDLDWTVIRVLKLQNVAPRTYTLTEHGPTKTYVGREEVTQAILQVLKAGSFIKQAPIISPPANA